MQGLGNDFWSSTPRRRHPLGLPSKMRALAHRHTGIGFDQALMLEAPRDREHACFYRIFNSDGGEVEQCGNGARCIAALLYARAPGLGRELSMGAPAGSCAPRCARTARCRWTWACRISIRARCRSMCRAGAGVRVQVDGTACEIGAVSMGNPHAVLRVADVNAAQVERFGPPSSSIRCFRSGPTSASCKCSDRGHIRLRVFERGVGETLACGTGACAAVAVGRRKGVLDARRACGSSGRRRARVLGRARRRTLGSPGPRRRCSEDRLK